MSIALVVTAILIALAGTILTILAICRYQSIKKLLQNGEVTIGTIEFIKNVRNQSGDYSYYQLKYTVNGKDYSHKILTRLRKFDNNQNGSIVYLPSNPRIAYCKCEYDKIRLDDFRSIIIAIILVFTSAIALLFLNTYAPHTLIDIGFGILMYIALWVWYIDEYNRVYRSKSTIGTIVYSKSNKRCTRVIAEYVIENQTYETRQMTVLLKKSRKYNIGDTINVKYREKRPYSAIIEDDTWQLLQAKSALVISSVGVLIRIILCCVF